jgi:nicotinate-nucleotide pyrophosphorylase (carboxylating)
MFVDGMDSSRFDLSSMIVLKDNYIWSFGRDTLTVFLSLLFDVEMHNKDQVIQVTAAGSDAIMLEDSELNPVTWCLRGV